MNFPRSIASISLCMAAVIALAAPPSLRAETHQGSLRVIIDAFDSLSTAEQAEVMTYCVSCSSQNGPANPSPGTCDGTCDTASLVCVPDIGTAARPIKNIAHYCVCVPTAEAECGHNTTSVGGAVTYTWAVDQTTCQYGKCPQGKTCKSSTINGVAACECAT